MKRTQNGRHPAAEFGSPRPKRRPCLWDGLIVLLILLAAGAAALFFYGGRGQGEALTAVLTVDGEEIGSYPLSGIEGEQKISLSDLPYPVTLSLSAEGAAIEESACPTQDCVHLGRITRSGESIICLPNRLTVRLIGGKGGVDAVLG